MTEKSIKIKLNKDNTTLIDLQNISRDTMQIMVLLSLMNHCQNKYHNDLAEILLNERDVKRNSIFKNSSKVNNYVNSSVKVFNYTKVEKGCILLTISISICLYNLFKLIHKSNLSEKNDIQKIIIQALKCGYKVVNPIDSIEDIVEIILEKHSNKFCNFMHRYEIDFMDSVE